MKPTAAPPYFPYSHRTVATMDAIKKGKRLPEGSYSWQNQRAKS